MVLWQRKWLILGSHEAIFELHSGAMGRKNGKVRFQKRSFAAQMTTSKHALRTMLAGSFRNPLIIMCKYKWMFGLIVMTMVLPSFTDLVPSEEKDFELIFEKNSVQVLERWNADAGGKEHRELKAVLNVRANHDALVAAVREKRKGLLWMQRVAQLESLPGGRSGQWRTYIRYGLPWPARDHDCVLSYQQAQPREGHTVVTFQSTQMTDYPPQKGVHRILGLSGRWEFSAQADSSYKVAYYVQTADSSPIPRFILDPLVRSNLLSTMEAFREVVEGR